MHFLNAPFAYVNMVFGQSGYAKFEVVTRVDSEGVPGGVELNQNCARNGDSDISVTVHTFTCKITPD